MSGLDVDPLAAEQDEPAAERIMPMDLHRAILDGSERPGGGFYLDLNILWDVDVDDPTRVRAFDRIIAVHQQAESALAAERQRRIDAEQAVTRLRAANDAYWTAPQGDRVLQRQRLMDLLYDLHTEAQS